MRIKRLYLVALGALGIFIAVILWGIVSQGLRDLTQARREQHRLKQRRIELEHDNERLRETLTGLESDPAAVEDAARKDLGWVRPGEQVILLATPTPPPTPGPLTGPSPTPILTLPK